MHVLGRQIKTSLEAESVWCVLHVKKEREKERKPEGDNINVLLEGFENTNRLLTVRANIKHAQYISRGVYNERALIST
jgi:hypothetical protein